MPRNNRNRSASIEAALKNTLHKVSSAHLLRSLDLEPIQKPKSNKIKVDFEELDLPRVSSQQLSRFLQYCSSMHAFALVKGAEVENKLNAVESMRLARKSELYVLYNDGRPKWQLEAEVEEDTQLKAVEQKREDLAALKTLIKAHIAAWESRTAMFSRELSRRASESNR